MKEAYIPGVMKQRKKHMGEWAAAGMLEPYTEIHICPACSIMPEVIMDLAYHGIRMVP
jgi:hypothetical protein